VEPVRVGPLSDCQVGAGAAEPWSDQRVRRTNIRNGSVPPKTRRNPLPAVGSRLRSVPPTRSLAAPLGGRSMPLPGTLATLNLYWTPKLTQLSGIFNIITLFANANYFSPM
jgi:hypothetical protein